MEKFPVNHRRVRLNRHVRELTDEVVLSHKKFIQPVFVSQAIKNREPSQSLNGVFVETAETIKQSIEADLKKGVSKFLLFPIVKNKSDIPTDFSFFCNLIKNLKKTFQKDLWLAADVCLCTYTSHGHCGILNKNRDAINNTASVSTLSDYALQLAKAGVDFIAPSDMMDGRVAAIRNNLDKNNFDDVGILSYSAKFSSAFYGPFRDICSSSPNENLKIKNRKSYQISMGNPSDAIRSTLRDIDEGADMVMVKPALPYLDIIKTLKERMDTPIAAYQVSGEYQAIELMAKSGTLERPEGHLEVWTSMVRSGADIVISYAARDSKQWIQQYL